MKKNYIALLFVLLVFTSLIAMISGWLHVTTPLEAVSFVLGGICVGLVVIESPANFPLSLINVSTFAVVFFENKLYGDAGLQLIYFFLIGQGWYSWTFGGKDKTPLNITRTSAFEWWAVCGSVVFLSLVLWRFLAQWGGAFSFFDGLTTAISLGAQWLTNRKKIESWFFWIVVDLIYLPLYVFKSLYLTAFLYFIFVGLAVLGFLQWKKKMALLKIVLLGAESTGKTMLAEKLANHFKTVWVPEYARTHWLEKISKLPPGSPPPFWSAEELLQIALQQNENEKMAEQIANKILFCDTNAFATGTWYERYYGKRNPAIDAVGSTVKADLYLFSRSDAPFIQDGVRDGEAIRDWMDARFHQQLLEFGLTFVSLTGNYSSRFKSALSVVHQICPYS